MRRVVWVAGAGRGVVLNIGFTGSRHGLTDPQLGRLANHLEVIARNSLPPWTAHHGGCVGADRIFHELCRDFWGERIRITIYPAAGLPSALCDWADADELRPPKPPMERNADIVAASLGGVLLACPQFPESHPQSVRSGTWATVRRARTARAGVVVFGAGGDVLSDRP